MKLPRFTVVIPAFNRERELPRAVASCLAQDEPSFEVVVVDDGSTDATAHSISGFGDLRLRLVRHSSNRGLGAARNTGARAGTGDWVVFLDSDDELLPGALSTIERYILRLGDGVDRLAFSYTRDDGRLSPWPMSRDETLDYRGYVASIEDRRLWDFLMCARRFTFDTVQFGERRCTDNCLYNLDFAAKFRTHFSSEAIAHVHLDCATRMSYQSREARVALAAAAERGDEMDCILQRHGNALRQFAPHTYRMYRRMRAAYHFLAGERLRGLRVSLACLRATPLSAEAWALPLTGFPSRRLFAALRASRSCPGQ